MEHDGRHSVANESTQHSLADTRRATRCLNTSQSRRTAGRIPETLVFTDRIEVLVLSGAPLAVNLSAHGVASLAGLALKKPHLLVLAANLNRTINRFPDITTVIKFDDSQCEAALLQHEEHGEELARRFRAEPDGRLRSDMCRLVMLHQFGGLYFDSDLGLRGDVRLLIDPRVTFVTCWAAETSTPDGFFQAFVGATPRHPVLAEALQRHLRWYAAIERRSSLQITRDARSDQIVACDQDCLEINRVTGGHPEPNVGTVLLQDAFEHVFGRSALRKLKTRGVAHHGLGEHASQLFHEVHESGLTPHYTTPHHITPSLSASGVGFKLPVRFSGVEGFNDAYDPWRPDLRSIFGAADGLGGPGSRSATIFGATIPVFGGPGSRSGRGCVPSGGSSMCRYVVVDPRTCIVPFVSRVLWRNLEGEALPCNWGGGNCSADGGSCEDIGHTAKTVFTEAPGPSARILERVGNWSNVDAFSDWNDPGANLVHEFVLSCREEQPSTANTGDFVLTYFRGCGMLLLWVCVVLSLRLFLYALQSMVRLYLVHVQARRPQHYQPLRQTQPVRLPARKLGAANSQHQ